MNAHYWSDIFGPYFIIGIGIGFAQVAVQIGAFIGVGEQEAGLVGGLIQTAGELGAALGVAIVASLAVAGSHAAAGAAHAAALTHAFHRAALACGILALAGGLLALLLAGDGRPRAWSAEAPSQSSRFGPTPACTDH